MKKKVLAILRDSRYCPKGPEGDVAIMKAVVACLPGCHVDMLEESQAALQDLNADMILSMGRLPQTLALLKKAQGSGVPVVNRPEAVETCVDRVSLQLAMQDCGMPLPGKNDSGSCWLKRGDANGHQEGDIVFCKDVHQLEAAKQEFLRRGISKWVVSPHVEGTLVKFYGVGQRFFRCYVQGGKEVGNPALPVDALRHDVMRLVGAMGISVYGGDCIFDEDGIPHVIDFNDWPSFSACREEAASAIVEEVSDAWRNHV